MANYSLLKAAIAALEWDNSSNLITGPNVQDCLDALIDSLGAHYQMGGIATTETVPGTPDEKVCYIAGPGTYPNFGDLTIPAQHMGIFCYNGEWTYTIFQTSSIALQNVTDNIVQLMSSGNPIFPRTKAEAVFFNSNNSDTLDKRVEGIDPSDPTALSIVDADGNIVAKINADGLKTIAFLTKNSAISEDGDGSLKITDPNGNIAVKIDGRHSLYDWMKEAQVKQLSQPALSWIDDDFLVWNPDNPSQLRQQYQSLRTWANDANYSRRVDFALIPDDVAAHNQLANVMAFEAENFRFLMHPSHDGWYDDPQGSGYVHNITQVKQHLHDCIHYFKTNGINSDCKILVWPGDSDKYEDNLKVVDNLCECGIKSTSDGYNYGNDAYRFRIQRLSIHPSASTPKSLIKKRIATYLAKGAWVILYTHLYQADNSGTTDETTNSVANVLDIATYADGLCRLRNTEAIWNERRIMYNL